MARALAWRLALLGALLVSPPAVRAGDEASGPGVASGEATPAEELLAPPSPTLYIRGFGDLRYAARSNDRATDPASEGFALGEMDLFLTSQIARDIRVLGEVVFHFDEMRDEELVEVERLLLQYQPSDAFGIRLGRVHTAIGHWSHTFHHGAWFQTTIDRPDIFRFEDDGGILPIHSVGLEVFGLKTFDGLDVQYTAGVFNGRGPTPLAIQTAGDANEQKALSAQLELLPTRIHGLRLGFSVYRDAFPPDPDRPERHGEMDERILAGHLVYRSGPLELLGERVWQRHTESETGRRFDSGGGYAQLAYRLGRFKPYARFDSVDVDETDPVFDGSQFDVDRAILGVRWDPSAWLALKLEYRSSREAGRARTDEALAQAAFTF